MYSIQKRRNCLLHFAHTAHMLISFFFCGSINLKMISTGECLLQTQIHSKKHTGTGKNQMENTKLHGNQNH